MTKDSMTAPFGTMYGPLNTGKILRYTSNLKKIQQDDCLSVTPVTAHLVPTLRCNHRCYFCTYGGAKGSTNPNGDVRPVANPDDRHDKQLDMPFGLLDSTLMQLKDLGVKGVIFTGGGEPTLYKKLPEAMLRCKERGMDCSLNTNGHSLTQELIDKILEADPTYIRISLNAGTPEVQRLITGVNDFEQVLDNLKCLLKQVHLSGKKTTVGVAFAVEIVNIFDIEPLVQKVSAISKELTSLYQADFPVIILVRPVTNYESSKNYNEERAAEIAAWLTKRSGTQDADDFLKFLYHTESTPQQTPKRILDLAMRILEETTTKNLSEEASSVKVFYPVKKFIDLPRVNTKTYSCCLALPWFLFIWPDGTVYPCVEWAGTPGFELGNLTEQTLHDMQNGKCRSELFEAIDKTVLSKRCAPVCAHHEMNLFLNELMQEADECVLDLLCDGAYELPADAMHASFL